MVGLISPAISEHLELIDRLIRMFLPEHCLRGAIGALKDTITALQFASTPCEEDLKNAA
jgi:hypothetical protein